MLDPADLRGVRDAAGLLALLGGRDLGWPVDGNPDDDFFVETELVEQLSGTPALVRSLVAERTDEEWLVLLVEFQGHYLRRDLRNLLASVRRHDRFTERFAGREKTLFVVTMPASEADGYGDMRFVRFVERRGSAAEIRSFGWTRGDVGRTVVTHNLPLLAWSNRDHWEDAWNVEGLTEEFYSAYEAAFKEVHRQAYHPADAPSSAGSSDVSRAEPYDQRSWAFVQQIFNRLLFTEFVDRMGWLRLPSELPSQHGYLTGLWSRPIEIRGDYSSFGLGREQPRTFLGLLGLLFHQGLDSEAGIHAGHRLYALLGDVEYLNGGLFTTDPELELSGATVADAAFAQLLQVPSGEDRGGLFRRYNFTVTESTPLDQEVAIDPEMLGKVFERLVNDRHQEGKYYTPRPIVSFMVNEALKGYLEEGGLAPEKAALLVDRELLRDVSGADGTGLPVHIDGDEIDGIVRRLTSVRAVDPACGSGAYLLGLLQKLFRLGYLLGWRREAEYSETPNLLYRKKLALLQFCIFGVDLDPTAVRIARLRLWLSLTVENPPGERPEPLPHLDFRIEEGDSLAVPIQPTVLDAALLTAYSERKRDFGMKKGADRARLRSEIQELRHEIEAAYGLDLPVERPENPALAARYDERAAQIARSRPLAQHSRKPFDWVVEFAEVFADREEPTTVGGRLDLGVEAGRRGQAELAAGPRRPGGFDIVLANPPYVAMGLFKELKAGLRREYPDVYAERADLYVYFFSRAVELLRPGGQLAFITSNKWLLAKYGNPLRAFLGLSCCPRLLIDFHELDVFENVAAYPMITLGVKFAARRVMMYSRFESWDKRVLDIGDEVARCSLVVETDLFGAEDGWQLPSSDTLLAKVATSGRTIPLGQMLGDAIYRGIVSGLNEVSVDPDGNIYTKGKKPPKGSSKRGVFVVPAADVPLIVGGDKDAEARMKPYVTGGEIEKWLLPPARKSIVYVKKGDALPAGSAIIKHLMPYREALQARSTVQEWYELQQAQGRFSAVFSGPKIVFPDISAEGKFALDTYGAYLANTAYALGTTDLFLLGVLNSSVVSRYYRLISNQIRGGFLRFFTQYVERIPIPVCGDAEKAPIESLVQQILERKSRDPSARVYDLEAEIDRRVDFLYFGDAANRSYDESRALAASEVRALLRNGRETPRLEFKSSFAWDVRRNEPGDFLRKECWAAICAFLNADGGDLLIGVDDDARVLGLRPDVTKAGSLDALVRSIESPFGAKLKPNPLGLVSIDSVELDDETVIRVNVRPDRSQIYKLDDAIYVRRNAASKPPLTAEEAALWWSRRQRGEA
jgi:hypothetical protein